MNTEINPYASLGATELTAEAGDDLVGYRHGRLFMVRDGAVLPDTR
ncbi:MAG: hypothetical protein J0M04_11990 [Verrucomicrobia bacterium]|nr:hypothetical protein [Verrucomicrobiota bacterium]